MRTLWRSAYPRFCRSPLRGNRCRWAPCSSWPGDLRGRWAIPNAAGRGWRRCDRRAELYGLAPVRWPEPWPSNYLFAMRACTYAFQVGQGIEFSLRAFRAAFQQGHDLGVPERVLHLAGEVGLDQRAVQEATQDSEVKLALRAATPGRPRARCLRCARPSPLATSCSGARIACRMRPQRSAEISRGHRRPSCGE